MYRVLLLASLLILFTTSASAQSGARFEGGASFAVGNPVGEFGDQVDNVGFGGHIFGAAGPTGSPFIVGVDLGFMIYGRDRRFEPFSTTIPDVTVEVVTDNNIVNGHLFVRMQPPTGRARPYADALVGFKYLFTQTRIRNEGFDNEDIARSTNFDDAALSYGLGGGVHLRLWQPNDSDGPEAVFLNVGARYLLGAEASYLKEGSIRREGSRVTFDVTNSETSLLVFQIGVAARF